MFYNILYTTDENNWQKFELLTEQELTAFVNAYNIGDYNFFANGGSQNIAGTKRVLIYDTSKASLFSRDALEVKINEKLTGFIVTEKDIYSLLGKNITSQYITDKWGHKKSKERQAMELHTMSVLKQFPSRPKKPMLAQPQQKTTSARRIFISHSSEDRDIVNMFCTLIFSAGLNMNLQKDVFNTSLIGSSPKSGEDFRNSIKEHIINAKLVIQFISQNYKESEVCLNEMGAAWVLNNTVVPMVLDKYDVGFINSTAQQVQLHDFQKIISFVEDHKHILVDDPSKINVAVVTDRAKAFVDWLSVYEKKSMAKSGGIAPMLEKKTEESKVLQESTAIKPWKRFCQVDLHNVMYHNEGGVLREIPDEFTLYFLRYSPQGVISYLKSNKDQIVFGPPVPSILTCDVWIDEINGKGKARHWLIRDGRRHQFKDVHTVTVFFKASKVKPEIVSQEKLLSISPADQLDLSKIKHQ